MPIGLLTCKCKYYSKYFKMHTDLITIFSVFYGVLWGVISIQFEKFQSNIILLWLIWELIYLVQGLLFCNFLNDYWKMEWIENASITKAAEKSVLSLLWSLKTCFKMRCFIWWDSMLYCKRKSGVYLGERLFILLE